MKTIKEQDFGATQKMEELLQDLLEVMKKLDLSIDYLASSVTGQDPFEIGLSQSALGRVVGKAAQAQGGSLKEDKSMKITKLQLRNIIQEVLDEVEFHGETPAGQLYGTEKEDAQFTHKLEVEKISKRAGLDREEMNIVFGVLDDRLDELDFFESSAYEKLFAYFAFSDRPGEQAEMPYGVAKARTGDPAHWILHKLRGPGVRRGVTSEEKKKITKKELQKIVQEEFKAVLERGRKLTEELSPEDYVKRIRQMPSVLNDLYGVALGDPDTLQYMPDFMTPEFAQKSLLGVASQLGLALEYPPQDQEGWDKLVSNIQNAM